MEQSRLDEEKTEDHAQDNPALNKVIERNIRTIIHLRLKAARERSVHDHIADTITSVFGANGVCVRAYRVVCRWCVLATER